MARRMIQIPVDESFYKKFDMKRRAMQKQLGLRNLSNRKFSQMVGARGDIILPKITSKRIVGRQKGI